MTGSNDATASVRRDPIDAAVNLITPIPRWRARPRRWLHRRVLGSEAAVQAAARLGLTTIRPVDSQFRRLSHLHFARWSIAVSLPRLPGAPRERGGYTLQIFTSHFDHGWRAYLGTFIESTQDGLAVLWGDTPSWRFATAGHRRFENFVVDQQVPNLHVFAAAPQWTCTDVRSLLRHHQDRLSEDAVRGALQNHLGAVDETAMERAFTRRLQHVLGVLPPPDEKLAATPAASSAVPPEHARPSHGATFLVPMSHEQADHLIDTDLVDHDALRHEASPFAQIPGTHFGRLAVIHGQRYVRHRPIEPFACSYLLVSAEIDADTQWWLRQLAARPEIAEVFEHTHLPRPHEPDDVASQLRRHCELPVALEHVNYPHTPVTEIYAAGRTRSSR